MLPRAMSRQIFHARAANELDISQDLFYKCSSIGIYRSWWIGRSMERRSKSGNRRRTYSCTGEQTFARLASGMFTLSAQVIDPAIAHNGFRPEVLTWSERK